MWVLHHKLFKFKSVFRNELMCCVYYKLDYQTLPFTQLKVRISHLTVVKATCFKYTLLDVIN